MTPEFAYFLKVNVAFVLFYAFYRLLFYKDTFFKLRRVSSLLSLDWHCFYPLLNIQDWVKEQEPMTEVIMMYSAMMPEVTITPKQLSKQTGKICCFRQVLIFIGVSWLFYSSASLCS